MRLQYRYQDDGSGKPNKFDILQPHIMKAAARVFVPCSVIVSVSNRKSKTCPPKFEDSVPVFDWSTLKDVVYPQLVCDTAATPYFVCVVNQYFGNIALTDDKPRYLGVSFVSGDDAEGAPPGKRCSFLFYDELEKKVEFHRSHNVEWAIGALVHELGHQRASLRDHFPLSADDDGMPDCIMRSSLDSVLAARPHFCPSCISLLKKSSGCHD